MPVPQSHSAGTAVQHARRSKSEHASAKLTRLSEILGCERRCRFRHFARRHRPGSIRWRRRSRTIAGRDCSEISQGQEGSTHGPCRRSSTGGPRAAQARRDVRLGAPAHPCKRSLRRGIARGRRGDGTTALRTWRRSLRAVRQTIPAILWTGSTTGGSPSLQASPTVFASATSTSPGLCHTRRETHAGVEASHS